MSAGRWTFGPFEFDAARYRLTRDGRPLAVQPKPLDLLARLLASPGDLVTREVLDAALYPGVTVSPHALRNVVLKLREALGADHEGWVQTVPRRGVRFVGPVVVDVAGAPDSPDTPRTAVHLPAERDTFFGREVDVDALADALTGARLVTVLGPGGVGKSRLALRHAWRSRDTWPGGVWFCDLTAASDLGGVVLAVARALDLPLRGAEVVAQLGHALDARGRCLLVLDDLERLVDAVGPAVGAWLDRAPELRILATSRERLGVVGERVFDLDPLPPDVSGALFVDRARAVDRRFGCTPEEVAALVVCLDGLPLAIELAAGRVRAMSVAAITQRLADPLAVLGSDGGRAPRHATLRAVLDDSWALLADDARRALAELSVFEGGFDVDAAEALVGSWSPIVRLVDQSVVRRVGARLGLSPPVKAFAAERLREGGWLAEAEARHGDVFATRAAAALTAHVNADRALAPDLSNLAAACRRARARGDQACAEATLRGVWAVVELQGPMQLAVELAGDGGGWSAVIRGLTAIAEGRVEVAEVALAVGHSSDDDSVRNSVSHRALAGIFSARGDFTRARGHARAAHDAIGGDPLYTPRLYVVDADIDRMSGDPTAARAAYAAAVAAARRVGDARTECIAHSGLGAVAHYHLGDLPTARTHYDAALALARARGASRDEGRVLGHLGGWHDAVGDFDAAIAHVEQALALHRRIGHRAEEAIDLGRLGQAHAAAGRHDVARPLLEAALAVQREQGDVREAAVTLGNLGAAWLALGHPERAERCLVEALDVHRAHRNRRFEGIVSGALGEVLRARGALADAHATLERALALHREIGNEAEQAWTLGQLAELWVQRGDLASAAVLAADGVQKLRDLGDRRDLPTLLCVAAEVALASGRTRDARAAVAEAEAMTTERTDPALRARLARIRGEASMGTVAYKVFTAEQMAAFEASGEFAGAPADLRDGYVHLSTAAQVTGTVDRHFAGQEGLVVAAIDLAAYADVRWEVSRGGARFPHVYGEALRLGTVTARGPMRRTADGTVTLPELP